MGKFVMECPSCGRYVEASNSFFARKKIDCSCGYVIDVKTDKMISKDCPHCGNRVVYDQSKGDKAVCPVCHKGINAGGSTKNVVKFTCSSCNCKLTADKNAEFYTCPLCDTHINVQQQVEKEKVKNQGLASVIKYEGANDVFVWKHPIEDFNLGSQLIVHESQEAIFFKDGKALDLFGAGRYTLSTHNLPVLEELYKLPSNNDEFFHSEVYFINMVTQMGIKWGTDSKVRLFDPASGLHIEIGACGSFNLRVNNSRKLLLKVVGTSSEFTQSETMGVEVFGITFLTGKFKALVMNKVKSNLARAIKELNINILEIDSYIDLLSEKLRTIINEVLDDYGLYMPEFFITSVLTPDDDPNYRRLKQQFADKTLRVREEEIRKAEAEAAALRKMVEAQTAAQLKMVGAQGDAEALKIKAMAEAEAYRMQAFAEADEMKAKGYSYQQETARKVGMEAMKNGLTGGEGGSGMLGDIAGLGLAFGAMGGVINMTKEALNPMMGEANSLGSSMESMMNNTATQPEVKADTWDCACGETGITSKFCPECGSKRPEPKKTWACPQCGTTDITSKFCPECGCKKPDETWICPNCGTKDIKTKFCPECGTKRGE